MLSLSPLELGIWAHVGAIFYLRTVLNSCFAQRSETQHWSSLLWLQLRNSDCPEVQHSAWVSRLLFLCSKRRKSSFYTTGKSWLGRTSYGACLLSHVVTFRAVRPSPKPCWMCWSLVGRARTGYAWWGWEKRKKHSSAHPPSPVRSRFRSSVWPPSQGQGSAQTRLGDHREHFSLLGKSCCLAAKIT